MLRFLELSRLAGAALVVLGLLLVVLDRWLDVGSTLATMLIGIGLAFIGTLALTRSLPTVPVSNRTAPKPTDGVTETPILNLLSNSGAVALLGAIGVAVTPLQPSGKAQFGGQFVDVIAEVECVLPGSRVQVVKLEGLQIVVKAV